MNSPSLREVRLRLDAYLADCPYEADTNDPQEIYNRIEGWCIAVLDSEYMDYGEGELEEYMICTLHQRALELGIMQFPEQKKYT